MGYHQKTIFSSFFSSLLWFTFLPTLKKHRTLREFLCRPFAGARLNSVLLSYNFPVRAAAESATSITYKAPGSLEQWALVTMYAPFLKLEDVCFEKLLMLCCSISYKFQCLFLDQPSHNFQMWPLVIFSKPHSSCDSFVSRSCMALQRWKEDNLLTGLLL